MKKKKHYNFRMDEDLHETLDALCKQRPEITKSRLVNTAIRQYLDNYKINK